MTDKWSNVCRLTRKKLNPSSRNQYLKKLDFSTFLTEAAFPPKHNRPITQFSNTWCHLTHSCWLVQQLNGIKKIQLESEGRGSWSLTRWKHLGLVLLLFFFTPSSETECLRLLPALLDTVSLPEGHLKLNDLFQLQLNWAAPQVWFKSPLKHSELFTRRVYSRVLQPQSSRAAALRLLDVSLLRRIGMSARSAQVCPPPIQGGKTPTKKVVSETTLLTDSKTSLEFSIL